MGDGGNATGVGDRLDAARPTAETHRGRLKNQHHAAAGSTLIFPWHVVRAFVLCSPTKAKMILPPGTSYYAVAGLRGGGLRGVASVQWSYVVPQPSWDCYFAVYDIKLRDDSSK